MTLLTSTKPAGWAARIGLMVVLGAFALAVSRLAGFSERSDTSEFAFVVLIVGVGLELAITVAGRCGRRRR